MFLSVVIVGRNQGDRWGRTVEGMTRLQQALPYPIEVILVGAGRAAGAASDLGWRVLRQPWHGPGPAARAGMLAAEGAFRLLAEPGWSVPPEQVQLLLPPVVTGADVVVASRHLPGSVRRHEPITARLVGRAWRRAVRALLLPDLSDARCGYIVFRAHAAEALFALSREDGPVFAVEILALARSLQLEVVEVPVDWTCNTTADATRLHPLVHGPGMLAGLLRVRTRLAAGAYAPFDRPPRTAPPAHL